MPEPVPDRVRLIVGLVRDLQFRGREQVVFGPFDEVNDPFVVVGGEAPERRGCGPVCELNAATPYRRIGVARFSPVPVCVVDAELHLKQGEGASVGDGEWKGLASCELIQCWHSSLSILAPEYVAYLAPCGGLVLIEATQEGTGHVFRARVRPVESGELATVVRDEEHGPLWELPGVTTPKGGLRLLDGPAARMPSGALHAGNAGSLLAGDDPRRADGNPADDDVGRPAAPRRGQAGRRGRGDVQEGHDGVSLDAKACACLVAHREWSCTQIAEQLGCHRTSLYRLEKFGRVRKLLSSGRCDLPPGTKMAPDDDPSASPTLEAWEDRGERTCPSCRDPHTFVCPRCREDDMLCPVCHIETAHAKP